MMPSVNAVINNGEDMGFGFMEEREIFDMCLKHARTRGCRAEGREMRTVVVANPDGRDAGAKLDDQLEYQFREVVQNHMDEVISSSDWDEESEEDAPTEDEDGDLLGVFNPGTLTAFIFGSADYLQRIAGLFEDVEYNVELFKFDTNRRKWID